MKIRLLEMQCLMHLFFRYFLMNFPPKGASAVLNVHTRISLRRRISDDQHEIVGSTAHVEVSERVALRNAELHLGCDLER